MKDHADPDLHLFLNDDDIIARHGLKRVVQTFDRGAEPVLVPEHPWEGSHLAYGHVLRDERGYHAWYGICSEFAPPFHGCIGYARSDDGLGWEKPLFDLVPTPAGHPTNVVLASTRFEGGMSVLPGIAGTPRFRIVAYGSRKQEPPWTAGVYLGGSDDGIHIDLAPPPALAHIGDRTNGYWDPERAVAMVTSRQQSRMPAAGAGLAGVKREIGLYESGDLESWTYRGEILKADDLDPDDTELYSLTLFRYGRGFVGLIEMYQVVTQRLDMQLAWSADGHSWQRVGRRETAFPTGASGAWDSQWVCVTSNPPELRGDRLRFWYSGASTKHASKFAHRRALGVAELRRDGFVALEHGAGPEGTMATAALPADEPRRLQVNLRAPTGRFSAEVLDSALAPLPGFGHADCRIEETDGARVDVTWAGGARVPPQPQGRIHLAFRMFKGEFYGYRWSPADV